MNHNYVKYRNKNTQKTDILHIGTAVKESRPISLQAVAMRGEKLVYILTQVSRRIQLYHSVAVVVFFFSSSSHSWWKMMDFGISFTSRLSWKMRSIQSTPWIAYSYYFTYIPWVLRMWNAWKFPSSCKLYMNHPQEICTTSHEMHDTEIRRHMNCIQSLTASPWESPWMR